MKSFHLAGLWPDERDSCVLLARGLSGLQTVISAGRLPRGQESAARVISAAVCDNPALCFHKAGMSISMSGEQVTFYPKYHYTHDETLQIKSDIKKTVNKILAPIPGSASDYDKVKHIHDYIVRNMRYESPPESDERGFHEAHTVIGPLTESTGVCEAFAKTMTFLLRRAGVAAVYVCGKSAFEQSGEGHSWNCVWIEGKPYHIDVTWDNSLTEPGGPLRYDYFNLTDAEIKLDHYDYIAPFCEETKENYFIREGLCVSSRNSMNALLAKAVSRRLPHAAFKFLPGKSGTLPDIESAIHEEMKKLKISGCRISVNPYQKVVMLSDMTYY